MTETGEEVEKNYAKTQYKDWQELSSPKSAYFRHHHSKQEGLSPVRPPPVSTSKKRRLIHHESAYHDGKSVKSTLDEIEALYKYK